jgi:hypothetical protein
VKSVFNDTDCAALCDRIGHLSPAMTPRWGRMSCGQMLAHLTDATRMALGDLSTQPKRGPLRIPPLRHAIIHWLPLPRDAPTAPELLGRSAVDCGAEIAALKALLERMADSAGKRAWPEHPLFGRISERDWGALVYKHIDHHLRQFGV